MRKLLTVLSTFFLFLTTTFAANSSLVVSENHLASQAGIDILRAGGNAIDAAVAVGYALAVVNPCCGNVGGGGFMVIHFANGKNISVNFREKAPLDASKNMFLNKNKQLAPDATTKGYLAVAVPGTVLGLNTVLKKYGTMQRLQVMAPAIHLARQGFKITAYEAKQFRTYTTDFREQPNVAAIFLKNGVPYKTGDLLIQTDLAKTLKLIAEKGSDAFYNGPIAKAIVTASQTHGGKLTMADFAKYTIEESAPVYCQYRGYTIVSAPPQSGSTTLCDMLKSLQEVSLKQSGYRSIQSIKAIVEAMRDGFIKRNNNTSAEQNNTTHYSVVDKQGNAIAVTYTINGFFGARVIADHTGFFLNNEMDDFTTQPGIANKFGLVQSNANAIQPGKRPLSSMTPTIVMKDGNVLMVLGSPGGPRIITTVLLTLINVIDYGMTLRTAVDAPRLHYQVIPDDISVEPNALPSTVVKQLTQLGYHIRTQPTWGAIEAIEIDPITENVYGANDYRRPDGAAISLN